MFGRRPADTNTCGPGTSRGLRPPPRPSPGPRRPLRDRCDAPARAGTGSPRIPGAAGADGRRPRSSASRTWSAGIDDRDPASHPAIELSHLEADVASAGEEDVAGELVVVEPVSRVEDGVRSTRPAIGGKSARVPVSSTTRRAPAARRATRTRKCPPSRPSSRACPRTAEGCPPSRSSPQAGSRLHQDAAGPVEDRGEVDFDRRHTQAEDRRPTGLEGGARGCDGRLARSAAEVDAGAAQVGALGDGDAPTGLRQRVGERDPGLSGADDETSKRSWDVIGSPSGLRTARRTTPTPARG